MKRRIGGPRGSRTKQITVAVITNRKFLSGVDVRTGNFRAVRVGKYEEQLWINCCKEMDKTRRSPAERRCKMRWNRCKFRGNV